MQSPSHPVKVTGKVNKKAASKTLKATITVKPVAIAAVEAEKTVAVGETAKDLFTVKPAGKKLAYKTSDATIATVDANGVVTAVKAGEATITASSKYAKEAATVKVTVKNAVFKSVAQTSKTSLATVFTGKTSEIKPADIVITNTYTKATVAVKSVDVDKQDATKVTVTTFADMADGKDYTVVYDGVEKTFTATDGVVVGVALEKTTIDTATETEMKAVLKDANGVELEKISYPGNDKLTFTINVTNGYTTANGLYLNKAGDTATVDLVYHSGKYDENGNETGNIENKGIVVTAADAAAVTDSNFSVKIGAAGKSYASVTEQKLAVGDDNVSAYFEIVKSNGDKVNESADYTVESSNLNVLILGNNKIDAAGIALTPVNAGTAYLIIKKDNTVVATLPVTVVAERKAASLALSVYSATLSNSTKFDDTVTVEATLKDQYGENYDISKVDVTALTAPTGATYVPTVAGNKITLVGNGLTAGTYQFKVAVGSLAKTLSLTVQAPNETAKSSYALTVSDSTVDAVIKDDATVNTSVSAKVYEMKNGVKYDVVSGAAFTLTKANGEDAGVTITAGAFDVNNISDGTKLAAGTYNLKVEFNDAAGKKVTFTRSITVTDSQPKAVVTVKNNKITSQSITDAIKVTYEGVNTDDDVAKIEITKWNGISGENVGTTITGTQYVKTVTVKVTLAKGNVVTQEVAVGQTIQAAN